MCLESKRGSYTNHMSLIINTDYTQSIDLVSRV